MTMPLENVTPGPAMPVIAHSITTLDERHRGSVAVTGSHGGLYPAYLAAKLGLRAVVFNDAAVGLDGAGIAGLTLLERVGIPAVAGDHRTATIGDGEELYQRGVVSHVNALAAALGCTVGMRVRDAVARCAQAPLAAGIQLAYEESRYLIAPEGADGAPAVWALDSVALTDASDDGTILVPTGSHGALLGGVAATAVRSDPGVAVYNDAGRAIHAGRSPSAGAR